MIKRSNISRSIIIYIILFIAAVVFLAPIAIILINSVKGNFYISDAPFSLPDSETFVGLQNFVKGFTQSDFMRSFAISAFITVFSVLGIIILTSMTAWYIVRVKNRFTKILYYLFGNYAIVGVCRAVNLTIRIVNGNLSIARTN